MIDIIAPYIQYLRYEKAASEHTITAYQKDLEDWLTFLVATYGQNGDQKYLEASPKLARRWMLLMMEEKMKPSTVARKLSAVRKWYTFLQTRGQISSNPLRGLRAPKKEQRLPTFVPEQALVTLIQRLYAEAEQTEDWDDFLQAFVVDLLYQTGLRRGELAGLELKHLYPERRELKVLGKRNKERIVPFGACLAEKIDLYLYRRATREASHQLLLCTESGAPVKAAQIYKMVKEALSAVPGLPKRSPHVLRHSFATSMLNHGSEIVSIKELLGHSGLGTTTIYTHTSFKELQQMYNAHPRAQKQKRMNIKIQANHFEPTSTLEAFVQKKVGKLERFLGEIRNVDVILSLVKPETKNNKEAKVIAYVKNDELFAEKKADTFEEAVVLATEAIEKQISKYKEKMSKKP